MERSCGSGRSAKLVDGAGPCWPGGLGGDVEGVEEDWTFAGGTVPDRMLLA